MAAYPSSEENPMIAQITLTQGREAFYSFNTSVHMFTDKTAGADVRTALQTHLAQRIRIGRIQVFHAQIGVWTFTAVLENYYGERIGTAQGDVQPLLASALAGLTRAPVRWSAPAVRTN
jgi:hypothetical protein